MGCRDNWLCDAALANPTSELCRCGSVIQCTPTYYPPLLGSWEARRYDFHWRDGPLPEPLRLHQEHQQDSLRHSWTGLIAGTDGGVKWRDERMSAGYVVGADPVPVEVLAVRVGGPLSTLRAEAAGLLQLIGGQSHVNLG